jgi:hypothetical protein
MLIDRVEVEKQIEQLFADMDVAQLRKILEDAEGDPVPRDCMCACSASFLFTCNSNTNTSCLFFKTLFILFFQFNHLLLKDIAVQTILEKRRKCTILF